VSIVRTIIRFSIKILMIAEIVMRQIKFLTLLSINAQIVHLEINIMNELQLMAASPAHLQITSTILSLINVLNALMKMSTSP